MCALLFEEGVNRNVDTGAPGAEQYALTVFTMAVIFAATLYLVKVFFEDTFRSYKHYKHVMEEGKQRAGAGNLRKGEAEEHAAKAFHHRASR